MRLLPRVSGFNCWRRAGGLLLLAALWPGAIARGAVEQWDTTEIVLHSAQAWGNPFREVQLRAVFSGSNGQRVEAPGFFDGEGTWRVRFMPAATGDWTWETRSNDRELDGRRGTIECVAATAPWLHGPLHVEGRHFVHADGTRRFLVSTRFSNQFADPTVFGPQVEFLRAHAINRVLFMLGGFPGQTRTLFGREGEDRWSYNVARWQQLDRWMEVLRRADIIASPYFYYFNDLYLRSLTPEQDEAYIRYGMARLGAYANAMPVLANEVEQKFSERQNPAYDLRSHDWANRMGAVLKAQSAFGLPVGIHNPMEAFAARNPGFFTLLQRWPFPWADFMLRQIQVGALGTVETLGEGEPEPADPTFNARAYARHNDLLIQLRSFGIPVINEEPGYEMDGTRSWNGQSAASVRAIFWTAATAGAYAMWGNAGTYETGDPLPYLQRSRVPDYLRTLARVMSAIPYWTMEPHNELVNANAVTISGQPYRRNFALAQPGAVYLVYARDGGLVEISAAPGHYRQHVERLNDAAPSHEYRAPPPEQIEITTGPHKVRLETGVDSVVVLQKIS